MKCSKCQFENPAGAKFCAECANPIEFRCPQCGAKTLETGKFCTECAHPLRGRKEEPTTEDLSFDEKIAKIQRYLPEGLTEKILSQRDRIEGEKKQVTVMFCDLEGFTALTERLGPEEAYSVMDDVYEILIHKVHDYEGTVNEMTGDGIVALFGAPIALEHAPQRAIRSAMAIHKEMVRYSDRVRKEKAGIPPLKMRIGIHSGPVVVGTLGNDLRVEFKAVGDTVNLASRMEELAKAGTTYVTEETFKPTEGFFRFESLGEKEIKGKRKATNVYQVIAPSSRRTRFDVSAERGLTPFVGRERELELLLDGFERAKAGRGQAFSIVAEAGIGKSRLLYEFRKAVSSEDITFLEGRCLSYGRGIAYHPHIDMLKSNFNVGEGDGAFQIREKVKEGLKLLEADKSSTLPYLLELLSVEESSIEEISLSPEGKKERILEALKRTVLKGSEIRPLIMAYEDLHWVDKSSEDALKYILESVPGIRVLLIFTYRPEFVHTWGGKSYHSQLNLNRLSNRESLSLAAYLLGSQRIDSELEELILEKTEGVPFFIEEFVRSLKDMRIIESKDGEYHLAKNIEEVTIPSAIQDVIMARVDSLSEDTKEVLQVGSVIDREFSFGLIKRVTNLPEQELLSRLSGLKDAELLYERGIYPESSYIFRHTLTQEVAYDSLLTKRKEEIHARIGKAMEQVYSERLEEYCELLAYHYSRSDNTEKTLEYLDLANRKAARGNSVEEAKAYFDEAMECLDTLPETERNQERRISLLVKQGLVFDQLFQLQEYHEILTRYEPLAGRVSNRRLLGEFYARMAHCEFTFGSFSQAVQSATRAAELCEATGQDEYAGQAYHVLEWIHFYRGDYDLALELKERVLRKIDQRSSLRTYVRALCAAAAAFSHLGRWDEAVELGEKALSIAQEFSDMSGISFAAFNIAFSYTYKCDLDRAIKYGELAVEQAPTPAGKAWAQQFLAWTWCKAGEAGKGIELLTEVLPAFKAGHYVPSQLPGMQALAEGYLLYGEYDQARLTTEELQTLAESCGAKYHIGYAHRLLGEIALNTDRSQAAPHFEKSISIFRRIKGENELALAYSGMGRLHKQQGDTEQAHEYLTKALEIFERLGTLLEPEKVKKELAELPE